MLCFVVFRGWVQYALLRWFFMGEGPERLNLGWTTTLWHRLHITLGSPVRAFATWSNELQTSDFFCIVSHLIDLCSSFLLPNSVISHHSTNSTRDVSIIGSVLSQLKRIKDGWKGLPTRCSKSGARGYRGGDVPETGVDCDMTWLLSASENLSDCGKSESMNELGSYWLLDTWE
jgi:hypothetical protein